jgi:arginase
MLHSRISILGAPLDLGAGRRGVDMGPSALRLAGLNAKLERLGYQVEDLGNVAVAQQESTPTGPENAKYLAQISKTCEKLAGMVEGVVSAENFPLVLGGDHSVAVGTVSGVSHSYRERGEKIGLIWVDAHADMNTPESSPSGNVHGMPLACCLGRGPKELTGILGYSPKVDGRNVVLIGIRDVDENERHGVRESGVTAFTMRDIDELGLGHVMERAIAIANHGTAGFHLSFDMEAHLAMETICDCKGLVSMEVVEVNPVLDEANRTALLAVELITSAMGKKIL